MPICQEVPLYLVSACLIGLCSRYDGQIRPSRECRHFLTNATWIPFCPEQMGGLSTPRTAATILHGDGHAVLDGTARVLTRDHVDVTEQFILGAHQTLLLAQSQDVTAILLKSRSPSCGVTATTGVTAALLERHGFLLREF